MAITPHAITTDCHDAATLAGFWAAALDVAVDEGANPFFASIGRSQDPPLHPIWMFIKVPEGKSAKNRVHVDFSASDREAEVERLVGLGASRISDHDEYGTRWTTLEDPEGNVFDIAQEA